MSVLDQHGLSKKHVLSLEHHVHGHLWWDFMLSVYFQKMFSFWVLCSLTILVWFQSPLMFHVWENVCFLLQVCIWNVTHFSRWFLILLLFVVVVVSLFLCLCKLKQIFICNVFQQIYTWCRKVCWWWHSGPKLRCCQSLCLMGIALRTIITCMVLCLSSLVFHANCE